MKKVYKAEHNESCLGASVTKKEPTYVDGNAILSLRNQRTGNVEKSSGSRVLNWFTLSSPIIKVISMRSWTLSLQCLFFSFLSV